MSAAKVGDSTVIPSAKRSLYKLQGTYDDDDDDDKQVKPSSVGSSSVGSSSVVPSSDKDILNTSFRSELVSKPPSVGSSNVVHSEISALKEYDARRKPRPTGVYPGGRRKTRRHRKSRRQTKRRRVYKKK